MQKRMMFPTTARAPGPLLEVTQPMVENLLVLRIAQVGRPSGLLIGQQFSLLPGSLLVPVGTVSKFAQPATGRGPEHLRKRVLEGTSRLLRKHLCLARQRLYHHRGYGLLCSQLVILLLGTLW